MSVDLEALKAIDWKKVGRPDCYGYAEDLVPELISEIERLRSHNIELTFSAKANAELSRRLKKKVKALLVVREALLEAIEMVSSEYCSHRTPCSSSEDKCYAQSFYKVLDEYESKFGAKDGGKA